MRGLKTLLFVLIISFCGCSEKITAPPSTNITTAERLRTVQRTLTIDLKPVIDAVTVESLPADKPIMQRLVTRAIEETGGAAASVEADVKREKKKDDHIADLEASDGWRTAIMFVGSVLGGLGIGIFILSFVPTPWTAWAKPWRGWAFCGAIVGLTVLTVTFYSKLIILIFGITLGVGFVSGLIVLAIYFWKNRNKAAEVQKIAVDVVNTLEKGKAAGEVVITDKGKDPDKSVMQAFQNPETAAFVEAVQKHKPLPT